MLYNTHKCYYCQNDFTDGETIYNICGHLFCESCVEESAEIFEDDESWVDDVVDEMRDLAHGW